MQDKNHRGTETWRSALLEFPGSTWTRRRYVKEARNPQSPIRNEELRASVSLVVAIFAAFEGCILRNLMPRSAVFTIIH